MVEYICPRCGHSTNRKSSMRIHLDRKWMCEPILEDVDVKSIKNSILNRTELKKIKKIKELENWN
jgi:hypothetical protein